MNYKYLMERFLDRIRCDISDIRDELRKVDFHKDKVLNWLDQVIEDLNKTLQ